MGASDFDFWLGRWQVSWGESERGTNEITRVLGGNVILEHFDGRPGTELEGMSVSAYDAEDGVWRQTWVDSESGYLTFEGGFRDGVMELRGEHRREPRRMLWRDIDDDSLTWLWQRAPNGDDWETLWQLTYSRLA